MRAWDASGVASPQLLGAKWKEICQESGGQSPEAEAF